MIVFDVDKKVIGYYFEKKNIISCIILLYYHIIYKSKKRRANELENTFDINNNEEKNVNGNEPLIK